jgi:hypothetical protein
MTLPGDTTMVLWTKVGAATTVGKKVLTPPSPQDANMHPMKKPTSDWTQRFRCMRFSAGWIQRVDEYRLYFNTNY